MRILHTSDWHLGRSFHGVGMLGAQQAFIDQLLETVRSRSVDVVLIAGDVYDRALPGVDVVALFDDALARIVEAGAQVFLSSGNHDSATRLGFGSRILAHGGVHLRTRTADLDQPLLLELDGARLAIYGIPYLEPRLVAEQLDAEKPSHEAVVRAAVDRISADLHSRAEAGGPLHSIVLAHVFASGALSSDRERDLSIGGIEAVPLDLFEPFTYTALGHLHGRQMLSPKIRYSGSPLPYSFSEATHEKGGWLIELDADGIVGVEKIAWPAARKLAVLRGELADLLVDPALEHAESAYCQVTLTDLERPKLAMERIRGRFPQTLVLNFEPPVRTAAKKSYGQRLSEATGDIDVCCGFVELVRGRAAEDDERELLADVLERVRSAEVSA